MACARTLILASTSPYRRELLTRLGVPFRQQSPGVEESVLPKESAPALVRRLALAKALAVAEAQPDAWVIGSDQVAILGDAVLSKPGTEDGARLQLRRMRGQSVNFLTAVCLLHARSGFRAQDVVEYAVVFRNYSDAEIERYLAADEPFDCAGSFRSEGLGISLVERMAGADPSALIGLPLIRLSEMLRAAGWEIP